MSNKKQNEELQSRREFFKKAAKAALPVVGAVVMASVPTISKAATGCLNSGCYSSCEGGCTGGCYHYCTGTCKGSCMHHCTAMQAGY